MRRSVGLVLGGLVLAVAACATAIGVEPGTGASTASTNNELIGGEAGAPYNTGVLHLAAGCTATMIGPNQILTAAHCVVKSIRRAPPPPGDAGPGDDDTTTTTLTSSYVAGATLLVTNSPLVTLGSNWFKTTVVGTDLSPDFQATCAAGCDFDFSIKWPYPQDLAVITVADSFPQYFGLTSIIPPPGSGAVPGDTVAEVGYGCQVSVNDASDPGPDTFKVAQATILDPNGTVPAPFKAQMPADGGINTFAQNYYITAGKKGGGAASLCPGDSGGPLFQGTFGQLTHTLGVNAYYFFPDNTGVSSVNVFTRLDSQNASTFLATVSAKYPAPPPPVDRGSPINDPADPVSSLFPISTVSLEIPGTQGCTGVILTHNSVLTAAHCKPGPTTLVHFYSSGANDGNNAILAIPASTTVPVATQGVVCDPLDLDAYPQSCFTSSGSTGALHNADLAVVTLAQDIPAAFLPVSLGPRGLPAQGLDDLPVWWEVTTGGTRPIAKYDLQMWAPITYDDDSDADLAQGWFTVHSLYGLDNDSGGPIFQAPYFSDAGLDGSTPDGGFFMDMTLVGLVTDIGPCGPTETTCSHQNSVVSVTFPDNYDWLIGLGALPVPAVATFGASR